MPGGKLPYVASEVFRHPREAEDLARIESEVGTLRMELSGRLCSNWNLNPEYTTVVGPDREYIEVSTEFCKLVGYDREELIGKKYDELTAPNTNDIQAVLRLFIKLGYMHGLWMLISRRGTRILVRYESWVRSDSLIESRMEVLGTGPSMT
jgi:PAS domain S-box-containing protein